MEGKVISISDNFVQIETKIGSFAGIWCDGMPEKNRKYILELDCPEIISKQQIIPAEESRFRICQKGERSEFTGIVEAIEDSVLIFRIGATIMMIETECPEVFHSSLGDFICISFQEIDLYDIGISPNPD